MRSKTYMFKAIVDVFDDSITVIHVCTNCPVDTARFSHISF